MAGIGFALRRSSRPASLVGVSAAIANGAVVAAGPWMFSVIAIGLIQLATTASVPIDISLDFRGLVIYAFAVSLLATAPVVNVTMRLLADDIYREDLSMVCSRYIAAIILSFAASAVAAFLTYGLIFKLEPQVFFAATVSTMVIGLIWPTLAICGAAKDYAGITSGFIGGLLLAVVGTVWVARSGMPAIQMLVTFVLGFLAILFWLAGRIIGSFPRPAQGIAGPILELLSGLRSLWILALASLIAIAAIWADKWVLWFSDLRVLLPSGLVSAPDYDGAMFIAYATIIPVLGLFVSSIETEVYGPCRTFLRAVQAGAPLDRIEALTNDTSKQIFRTIYRILLAQMTICIAAILTAHWFVPWIGLQYQQLGILRFGLLATFFQLMFLSASSILLFFDRHVRFLALQALFLATQTGLTFFSLRLGQEFLGFAHLVACALCAAVAIVLLERTLAQLPYLTFSNALKQKPQAASRREEADAVPVAASHKAVQPEFRTSATRPASSGARPLLRP